jgi:outer membrane biosynthesis protein TonB
MEYISDKEKRSGLIGTILFHTILLLIFLFFGLTYPVPRPEQGILVNFGTSDQGMGDVQPDVSGDNNTPQEEMVATPTDPTQASASEQEILTQENLETIEVKEQKKKTKTEKEPVKEVEKEEQKISDELSKTLEALKKKNQQGGGSEGTTDKAGDQGKIDGSKDGTAYEGGGSGKGFSYQLSGRKMTSAPRIDDNSQEEGKVVVTIKVDRNGKVIEARPGARGTTTTSALLFRKAKESAEKTEFSANPNAPEIQTGEITFIFILN